MTVDEAIAELAKLDRGIESIRSAIGELGKALRPTRISGFIFSPNPLVGASCVIETLHNPTAAAATVTLGTSAATIFSTTIAAGATLTNLGLLFRNETLCIAISGGSLFYSGYLV